MGEWLSAGVDVVIADGPFYTQNETTALMERVPTGIVARPVMLLCADEAAHERVAGEPSRGASRTP